MPYIPETMNKQGAAFLKALALHITEGVFLEIGPAYGGSTNLIAEGRIDDTPIHSIDTFEEVPWLTKRIGIKLSRTVFDKYTKKVSNLVVHEGAFPDVVRDTWTDKIGFYYYGAMRGNPECAACLDFFKDYFTDDCIICGDFFAGDWGDIVQTVSDYAKQNDLNLYVYGRFWAMTHMNESRIEEALDALAPMLENTYVRTTINGETTTSKAGVWSSGVHQKNPVEKFSIMSDDIIGSLSTFRGASAKSMIGFDKGEINLEDADKLLFLAEADIGIQFCILEPDGTTTNGKVIQSGRMLELKNGQQVVAIRLVQ